MRTCASVLDQYEISGFMETGNKLQLNSKGTCSKTNMIFKSSVVSEKGAHANVRVAIKFYVGS